MQNHYQFFPFTHLAPKCTIFTYCPYKFHQTLHIALKISRRFVQSNCKRRFRNKPIFFHSLLK